MAQCHHPEQQDNSISTPLEGPAICATAQQPHHPAAPLLDARAPPPVSMQLQQRLHDHHLPAAASHRHPARRAGQQICSTRRAALPRDAGGAGAQEPGSFSSRPGRTVSVRQKITFISFTGVSLVPEHGAPKLQQRQLGSTTADGRFIARFRMHGTCAAAGSPWGGLCSRCTGRTSCCWCLAGSCRAASRPHHWLAPTPPPCLQPPCLLTTGHRDHSWQRAAAARAAWPHPTDAERVGAGPLHRRHVCSGCYQRARLRPAHQHCRLCTEVRWAAGVFVGHGRPRHRLSVTAHTHHARALTTRPPAKKTHTAWTRWMRHCRKPWQAAAARCWSSAASSRAAFMSRCVLRPGLPTMS